MRIKLRRIGNSKGVILPGRVVARLRPHDAWGDDDVTLLGVEQVDELELTLIGKVAVLTSEAPDELELQAALAYAAVKWRRRRLLRDLAEGEAEHPVLLQAARQRDRVRARRRR